MNQSRLSVSSKIGIGFGFMIMSVIGAGVFCWIMMHMIESEWSQYATVTAEKKSSVADAALHLQRATFQVVQRLQRRPDSRETIAVEMQALSELVGRYRNAGSLSPTETGALADLTDKLKRYAEFAAGATVPAEGVDITGMVEKLNALDAPVTAALKQLDTMTAEQTRLASEQVTWLVGTSKTLISVLTVIVSIIAVVIALALMRGINHPLTEVLKATDNLRAGEADLTRRLPEFAAEFGAIARSFNEFVEKLEGNIARVGAVSDSIGHGTREIVAGNRHLAERTERDGAALEEVAASIEEVTTSARQNAENATAANELASSASSAATKGGDVVSRVIATMEDIDDSANQIEEIVRLIDSIAFQTNILALNAAVEAARAGDEGRGFAVVAAEVRALAQRSAAAAKDVRALIRANVAKGQAGGRLANEAGTAMNEIAERIQRVTEITTGIALASREQSIAFEQVRQSIAHLEESAQQRAALTEQSSATAAQFEEHGRHLVEVVRHFKVGAQRRDDAEPEFRRSTNSWAQASDSVIKTLPEHAKTRRRLR
ncbi:MAG: methyl-accepting chemotaxis protein [Betaproteobacteria bacterium]